MTCNFAHLEGRLTADAKQNTTRNGKSYITFSIAVYDGKDGNGNNKSQFIPVSVWDFEAISALRKGTMVKVDGKLNYRREKDDSGNYDTFFNVTAYGFDSVAIVPQRNRGNQNGYNGGNDDIPF